MTLFKKKKNTFYYKKKIKNGCENVGNNINRSIKITRILNFFLCFSIAHKKKKISDDAKINHSIHFNITTTTIVITIIIDWW